MDRYIVLLDGPLEARNRQFAKELIRLLSGEATAKAVPFSELPAVLDMAACADCRYSVVYGDGVFSHEELFGLADFRVFIESSQLDIRAAELKGRKASRNLQSGSLNADIAEIVKGDEGGSHGSSDRKGQAHTTIGPDEMPQEAVVGLYRYILRTDPALAGKRVAEEERKKRINEMAKRLESSQRGARLKARVKRALWMALIKATLLFKRILDFAAAFTILLILSPLLLTVALIIKATDRGPVFYTQTRIGRHGKPFPFPKFRSMVLNADKMKDNLLKDADRVGDVTFKMKHDPRVTRIGRFIRRFSIDEMPQLWCVLKGEMSLVGPRPPVPREVALYTQEDRRRLEVTPGLTGIWQVSGRADIEFKRQVELDVLYIESHGFWLDILLLFKTIPAVLTGRGAY